MKVVRRIAALRSLIRRARRAGETVGFVPTMGALHEGHLSLVRRARGEHDRVVVSVFVNPLQFGPREDLARYPRDPARDARLTRGAGCDWFFLPSVRAIYPEGCTTRVVAGRVGSRWEGAARPGHFDGVATVVLKLLEIVAPDALYLGQKDAQQAQVVGAMIRDLDLDTRLVISPTVRDRDGLALSSRNAYLSAGERARAAGLIRALRAGRAAARAGAWDSRAILAAARRTLLREARPDGVDYLALVDPRTFEPLKGRHGRGLLIAAIRIGRTRLIDNLAVPAPRGGARRVPAPRGGARRARLRRGRAR